MYGGKEFQDDDINGNSLEWYDFGARNYDASLGRWMNIDPLADRYPNASPYNFVLNSPLIYIDPDGRKIIVAEEEDRETLLNNLSKIYGKDKFSFNDKNELQFNGKIKNYSGDAKKTLKELNKLITNDIGIDVKLSGFTQTEETNLDANLGAYSAISQDGDGNVIGAKIFLSEKKLKDITLYNIKYTYVDKDGKLKHVDSQSDVPEKTKYYQSFEEMTQNGKVKTVPHGGGSVAIMHEFFHVLFENDNQRKINRYDNKVRGILNIKKRSNDDPKHNTD